MEAKIRFYVIFAIGLSFLFSTCRRTRIDRCENQVSITEVSVVPTFQTRASGVLTIKATGDSTLTYSITDTLFQSSSTFINLPAKTYRVTAKNSKGCTDTTSVTIGVNPDICAGIVIGVSTTKTDPTNNQANGTITVTASGGSGFSYSKDGVNYQASNIFSGLAPGKYKITAKTAAGCSAFAEVTLSDICAGVTVTVTAAKKDPTNNKANGSITVTATGGSGFTYSKDSTNYQASNVFENLGPGPYKIFAKSGAGCTGSTTVTLADPCAGVNITVTADKKDPTNNQANGTIVVTATGGTGFTYSKDSINYQISNTFVNLAPGTYPIVAKTPAGCYGSIRVVLTDPCAGKNIVVSTTTQPVTDSECAPSKPGSITVTASGSMGFTYSINGVNFQTSNVFVISTPGTYTVRVRDSAGCVVTRTVTVTREFIIC